MSTVPHTILTKINKALESEGLEPIVGTHVILAPGDSAIPDNGHKKHATKHYIPYDDCPESKRNELRTALAKQGNGNIVVAAAGFYVQLDPLPTPAKDDAPGVEVKPTSGTVPSAPEAVKEAPPASDRIPTAYRGYNIIDNRTEPHPYDAYRPNGEKLGAFGALFVLKQAVDNDIAYFAAVADSAPVTPRPFGIKSGIVGDTPATPEQQLRNWQETARFHLSNEMYFRKEVENLRTILETVKINPEAAKRSDIKTNIQPTDLDKLLNDRDVTILHLWGNGDALNVAYYRMEKLS